MQKSMPKNWTHGNVGKTSKDLGLRKEISMAPLIQTRAPSYKNLREQHQFENMPPNAHSDIHKQLQGGRLIQPQNQPSSSKRN
mmetsp:Transcript_2279/g.3921  ORF Transcript_2279/g.3921 Transcript_2279/m.3921 type:complete len:83 (+) Transcript_2279:1-249(+)